MKQLTLIILALLTLLIGVSILPGLMQELRAKKRLEKDDAIALAGLMLALIPFALLLPNPHVEFNTAEYFIEEDENGEGKTVLVTVQIKNRQLLPVTVQLKSDTNIPSGNPASSDDFTEVSEEIRLHVFRPSARIPFHVTADDSHEEDEAVRLVLSNASNANLGNTDKAIIHIKDNDPITKIQFSDDVYTITEPTEQSVATAVLTATLDAPSGLPVQVDYSTRLGQHTATANVDFVGQDDTLTFAPGETIQFIEIPVLTDAINEPDETVEIILRQPKNALFERGNNPSAVLYIKDNDALPILSLAQAEGLTVQESADTAVVNAVLSAPSEQAVTVNYSATHNDITLINDTVTIPKGATSRAIEIPLDFANEQDEPDKIIQLVFQKPQYATFAEEGPLRTELIIADDDAPPTAQFLDDSPITVAENEGEVAIEVGLSTSSAYVPAVNYQVNIESSTAVTDDYQLADENSLQFVNVQSNSFTVKLTDDTQTEPTETLILTLSDPISATLGSPIIKVINIIDDDGSCTPRPAVDRNNDGEVDIPVNLLFVPSGLDLHQTPDVVHGARNRTVEQDEIQCVLSVVTAAENDDQWYQVRLLESGDIGWILDTGSGDVEALVAPAIEFNNVSAVHLSPKPGIRKSDGPYACEDSRRGCGQGYILGIRAQSTVDDSLWLQVVLQDKTSGWIQAARFQGLDLLYLREHLPEN